MKIGGVSAESIKLVLRGLTAANKGDLAKAIESIEEAIKHDDGYYEAKYYLGRFYAETNRLKEAAELLTGVVKEHPSFSRAWALLGDIYEKLGDREKGVELTIKAREMSRRADDLVRIGGELEIAWKLEEAKKKYVEATEADESFPSAWYALAHIHEKLNELEGALDAFDKIIRMSPEDIFAWNKRVSVLKKIGRFDEAVGSYDILIEIDPTRKMFWLWKAKTAEEVGMFEEAISCYDKVLELDPRDTCALEYKAGLLGMQGRHEEEAEIYRQILELEPENKKVFSKYIRVLISKLNRLEEAAKILNKAIESDPDEPSYHYLKAEILLKQGNEDEALQLLEKVIRTDMTQLDAWLKMAEIYEKRGDTLMASQCYEMITKLLPSDPRSWYMRARFMAKIGKAKDALKFIEKALGLDPSFKPALELKEELSK